MTDAARCSICQNVPPADAALQSRDLVPRRWLESVFELDPLGTAGGTTGICEGCLGAITEPMLTAEDVHELSRAFELYRQAHPSSGLRDEQGARVRLWHRALHLGVRALSSELLSRPVAPVARPEPDQLGLFASKASRLAKVEAALGEGAFAQARALSEELVRRFDLPEARYLAVRLAMVEERLAVLREQPEAIAALAEAPEQLVERSRMTVSLTGAFARGLHRLAAETAERTGGRTPRPVGWHWLKAGDRLRARQSLRAEVERGERPGLALLLMANLSYDEGSISEARELYRRALSLEPEAIDTDEIADAAVQEAVEEAVELGLGPAQAWAPLVGFARGIFQLPAQPDGSGEARQFLEALLESRHERGVDARRRMQQLAPALFAKLLEGGRL